MGVYHQMGHDSWNLIDRPELQRYSGLILSPVNNSQIEVSDRLDQLGFTRNLIDIILDPQLYKPRSDRGKLATWPYFPNDLDSADLTKVSWWVQRGETLIKCARQLGTTAICSPAMLPRVFDDAYYSHVVDIANQLHPIACDSKLEILLTAIVDLKTLTQTNSPHRIATVLTRTKVSRVYLIFLDDLKPRQQRTDYESLSNAATLITLLESAGTKVIVGFSGLDGILWKHAGATDLATGKFFNLRRFVPGRWDDAADGGKPAPYWTDDGLIAWLREPDVQLLLNVELIDRQAASRNPHSAEILQILDSKSGTPWLAIGWRQYLYWFQEMEQSIGRDPSLALKLLLAADKKWGEIEKSRIQLYDRLTDGEWIRPWINAITEASR
ncbi:hypothetical protein [Burkholderia contaminans]|uniref:hypothetical protein n=1 Tax=Burkholderia contaminans TaxID=488447 RepID=UPI001588D3CC|nr:hypothetical protein [Burkholderia contaminans]